jgi:lipid II:glycine glycyltransferase (peptidoglycan interpeptide bridge formation enzyme)
MENPLETTWTRELSTSERSAFEDFVVGAAGGHFAQTPSWDRIVRTTRSVTTRYFIARREGAIVGAARVTHPKFGVPLPVASVERGPVVARVAELRPILDSLSRIARRHGVARLNVMPYWTGGEAKAANALLREEHFRDIQTADGSHARTLRVDLRDDPFAGGDRETLRRKLRKADEAGVRVTRAGTGAVFPIHALHEQMMRIQGKSTKPLAYFKALDDVFVRSDRGAFFLATQSEDVLAAVCVLLHGEVATFVVGASGGGQRKFSKMAPALAEAMRWSKLKGAKVFDLGGIPVDDDRDPKRLAISQFKFDFSKRPILLTREHARFILLR